MLLFLLYLYDSTDFSSYFLLLIPILMYYRREGKLGDCLSREGTEQRSSPLKCSEDFDNRSQQSAAALLCCVCRRGGVAAVFPLS